MGKRISSSSSFFFSFLWHWGSNPKSCAFQISTITLSYIPSSGWAETHSVVQAGFVPITFLPQLFECGITGTCHHAWLLLPSYFKRLIKICFVLNECETTLGNWKRKKTLSKLDLCFYWIPIFLYFLLGQWLSNHIRQTCLQMTP